MFLHDGRRWRIGRIDGVHPQDPGKYLIAFPNGHGEVLPVEAFDVRWNAPINDPFEVLAATGVDSPAVYDSRVTLISEWSRQRAAAAGAEGLLLGSVELHPHQLRIVRRVADDPIQRYLLADEVGLGKTIEAGALIWQFLSDHPSARVLVLAPDHLREQWATELLTKFHVNHFSSAWLRIRAHTDEASWPVESVDLLVVDEAHHVTRAGNLSSHAQRQVANLAHGADKVLLLSATPVRSNEAAFLDLLHLLDPEHYRPDELEAFVRRVELRDRLALIHQALLPDLAEFDVALYAEELTALFPEDQVLGDLLSQAAIASDGQRPELVARIREHLSETYRLHHRMLRTRRTPELSETFRVRGRRRGAPFTLDVADESDDMRSDLLDSVREHLVAACEQDRTSELEAVETFRHIAERCGSLPQALLPLRAAPSERRMPSALTAVHNLVQRGVLPDFEDLVRELGHRVPAVMARLVDALSQVTVARGTGRAVVASGFTEVAEAAATSMAERWGWGRVALHLMSRSREQNTEAVARWTSEDACTLLFCDAGADEGINLQRADTLVHLDLPWDAFRLEQRIGRCDRHVRTSTAQIPSTVAMYGDQTYARNWFEFLADGCGVFDRSVSSLHHVLSDTERIVLTRALGGGPESLLEAVAPQTTTLAAERTKVEAHDALDSIETHRQSDIDDDLVSIDACTKMSEALTAWLAGVGCDLRRDQPGVLRMRTEPRPQVTFDVEVAIARWTNEPLATERSAAVAGGLPVLRSGHGFVDAIVGHLLADDRGVAFSFFRPVSGHWPPSPIFRTDFLVGATPSARLMREATSVGLTAWISQLVCQAFPPIVESIFMREDGVEVPHSLLRKPYSTAEGDRNLASHPELFDRLTTHLDWMPLCTGALTLAERLVRGRTSVRDRPKVAADRVRREVMRRSDQLRARRLTGLLDAEPEDLDGLIDAVPDRLEHQLTVLGCGAILLADPATLR